MRSRWGLLGLLAVLMLLVALTAACSRGDDGDSNEEINLEVVVSPNPPVMGAATIEVTLTDGDDEPVTGADLQIEGNMNHAGMEPVFSDLVEDEDGHYVTQDFEFTMGGDWVVTVRGNLADGEPFEQTVDVEGVEG